MRGYTLLELLVVTFIFAIIIAGVFAVLNTTSMTWNSTIGNLQLEQGVRLAMDGLTRETRGCKANQVTVNNGGARLDFYVPDIAPILSYYLLNNQLIREYPAGTVKVVANNINNLSFCCVGGADCVDCANANSLLIQINAYKNVRGIPLSFSLKEQVKLRN